MSIWTCRRSLLCLFLGLLTAGCEEGALFGSSSGKSFVNPRRDVSLQRAELAGGAVTLAPPVGFCVDRRSLQPSFAVIARCDSLGARRPVPDAPLGMILVSVATSSATEVELASALAASMPSGAEVLDTRETEPLALMMLRGDAPVGADRKYWRGLAQVGPYLLGLTVFAPAGGELAGDAGSRVLEQLVQRTAAATAIGPAAVQGDQNPVRTGSGGILASLSD